MSRSHLGSLVLVAVLASVLTHGIGLLVSAPSGQAAPAAQTRGNLVRAEQFELVDQNGAVRLALGVTSDDRAGMVLFDREGQPRLTLGENPGSPNGDGGIAVGILDEDGQVRLAFGLRGDNSLASYNVRDEHGRIRANFSYAPDSPSYAFRAFDAAGQPRATLGFHQQLNGSFVNVLDDEGRIRGRLAVEPGGGASHVQLMDEDGEVVSELP